jgi:4-hydroxythreonine-4-phosphate dehydrogenase
MKKPIAIIAGEPNSISSEIIFKSWQLRRKYTHKPFLVIGSIHLLNLQKKKLKYRIKIKKINNNFVSSEINDSELAVYDVKYIQKKAFQEISDISNKYIFRCFDVATNFIKNKKILGFINCPIAKEFLFKNKQEGITEFLAKKEDLRDNEVMLIFNRKLSVSPLTTHIPFSQINKKITKSKIIRKVKIIDNFYKKTFSKKPNIGILGLNPHNFTSTKKKEEKDIISPAIKALKKLKIKVIGPLSPDTSFVISKRYNLDVILGMYHDQVLTPFKALFKYDAINITLGLPYFRISPDHGIAKNIIGKKIANPKSLIESIKFFNYVK